MDPHDHFNRKLVEFVADVKPLVGHLPEYALLLEGIKWFTRFTPDRNQQIFDRYVAHPYEARIVNEDEAFFMTDPALDSHQQQAHTPGIVDLLRSVWQSRLDDTDKRAVWKHLQVLIVLNRRCCAAAAAANGAAAPS